MLKRLQKIFQNLRRKQKMIETYKKVPTSKFVRERRKWLRYVEETNEPIIITHRSRESVVLAPIKFLEDLGVIFS